MVPIRKSYRPIGKSYWAKGLSRRSLREYTIEALDVLVQIMLTDTHAFKRAIDMTDDELAAIVVKASTHRSEVMVCECMPCIL